MRDGLPRDRLYVALDFQSIKVPAFEVEYIDHEVTAIVDERIGGEWDREIYRIYPGENKQELMGRVRWLSPDGEKRLAASGTSSGPNATPQAECNSGMVKVL